MRALLLVVLVLAGCFCGCSFRLPADVAEDVKEARSLARGGANAILGGDPAGVDSASLLRGFLVVEDYSTTLLWMAGEEKELPEGTRVRNELRKQRRADAKARAGRGE